jgi:hypothetical protein
MKDSPSDLWHVSSDADGVIRIDWKHAPPSVLGTDEAFALCGDRRLIDAIRYHAMNARGGIRLKEKEAEHG